VDLQPAPAIVVNEDQLSESIHEKADPPTSGADHLCKSLLADFWDDSLRDAFLAKMSKHQKDTG
jgi:hypothetical protein